ncbi:hypothetical protein V6N11_017514 [Hibiscus sabdariffa]|uniref:Uncharacterized protein n=1 Tax=Hibiscus sabdariffa TaxID=183260 RepID=A0ABR2TYK5_9ROSI
MNGKCGILEMHWRSVSYLILAILVIGILGSGEERLNNFGISDLKLPGSLRVPVKQKWSVCGPLQWVRFLSDF